MQGKTTEAIRTVLSIDPNYAKNYVNDQLGEVFLEMEAGKQAIPYLKKMIASIVEKEPKFFALNLLGRAYLLENDYYHADQVFLQQYELAVQLEKRFFLVHACNNLLLINLSDKKYFKAEKYAGLALQLLNDGKYKSKSDSTIEVSLKNNVGILFFQMNAYQRSLPFLEFSFDAYKRSEIQSIDYSKLINTAYYLHRVYLELNLNQKATALRTYIKLLNKPNINEIQQLDMRFDAAIFAGDVHACKRLSLEKNQLLDQIELDRHVLESKRKNLLASVFIHNAKNSINIERLKKAKAESTKLFTIFISIVIVLVFASFTFFIVYSYKQAKKRINLELELKKGDIRNFSMDLTHRINERDQFIVELTKISKLSHEQVKNELKKMIAKVQALANSRTSLEKFLQNIDQVNESFYTNLKSKHSDLSQYDQEFCGYIKLGMSNKDISNIKHIEVASVRTSRARVKKRLGLNDQDLFNYLQGL